MLEEAKKKENGTPAFAGVTRVFVFGVSIKTVMPATPLRSSSFAGFSAKSCEAVWRSRKAGIPFGCNEQVGASHA